VSILASIPSTSRADRRTAEAAPVERVWGFSPDELHDRFWAAKRIQVVRLGSGSAAARGPGMYLLIEPEVLVVFDLKQVMRVFNRVHPRAARVRVRDEADQAYTETVVADREDRFVAFRRTYRPRTHSTARVWLTPDPAIANLWARAETPAAGRAAVKGACGPRRIISQALSGRVFGSQREGAACTGVLMQRWKTPSALIEDIYEYQPGVWLHEDTDVPEDVRFVAPVWAGAGITLKPGQVYIGPHAFGDAPGSHPPVGEVCWDNLSIPAYRLLPHMPNTRIARVFKRGFDIVFAAMVLLITAPLYPLIILAIWMEDGWPPFFAHTRQTLGGRPFPCYKFRTMYRNAEHLKARLVAANVCDGPQFYIENDPRVLKVGKVLRKFQLDELPQFWNVLLGHMSVVGPRPSPDKENQFCPAWREARLSVRPGITGLWQVRRTREPQTDFQEWIRYDLEYVQHATWKLDLWIIMLTIRKVLGG
jgi:lipopolysaccharide/colanic/teichoic acid biosynthesis glycosyltransferase